MINDNDFLRSAVIWLSDDNNQQVNVFTYQVTDIIAQTQDEIRNDISEYFSNLYSAVVGGVSNRLDHFNTTMFNITADTPEVSLGRDSTLDGTNSGQMLPLQVTALCWMLTTRSRTIGKKYLPTFTEGAWDGSRWSAGDQSNMADFCSKWVAPFIGTNSVAIKAGVYHKATATMLPGIEARFGLTARIQRRRRPGVGV